MCKRCPSADSPASKLNADAALGGRMLCSPRVEPPGRGRAGGRRGAAPRPSRGPPSGGAPAPRRGASLRCRAGVQQDSGAGTFSGTEFFNTNTKIAPKQVQTTEDTRLRRSTVLMYALEHCVRSIPDTRLRRLSDSPAGAADAEAEQVRLRGEREMPGGHQRRAAQARLRDHDPPRYSEPVPR